MAPSSSLLPPAQSVKPLLPPDAFTGPHLWTTNNLTFGGVERQILATAASLSGLMPPVHLLCAKLSGQSDSFFLREASPIFKRIHTLSSFSAQLAPLMPKALELAGRVCANLGQPFVRGCATFAAFYQRLRPRVVQAWNGDNLAPSIAAVLAGVPEVIILGRSMSPRSRHPYGFESIDDGLARQLFDFLLPFPSVKLANNSTAGRDDYADWLGVDPRRIFLTRNAFVPELWEASSIETVAALRKSYGIPADAPVIGGLFRFVSIKDPELWVHSAGQALQRSPGAYAVLGGDGPLRRPLMDAVAGTPLAGRMLFPGLVHDAAAFYTMCDVFLLTSHVEGLPNVALEAQYFETPVVSTLCGGVADAVEDGKTGLIAPARSPEHLAARLLFALNNPEWSKAAGISGRARVLGMFSAEEAAKSLLRIYQAPATNWRR